MAERIAVFVPTLSGGGVAKSQLRLAAGLRARGYEVDFVVCRAEGEYRAHLPPDLHLVPLQRSGSLRERLSAFRADPASLAAMLRPLLLPLRAPWELRYLPSLVDYLRSRRPAALISAKINANCMAILARKLAGAPCKVVVTERGNVTSAYPDPKEMARWRRRYRPALVRRLYPQAGAIVSVSEGVAEDLASRIGVPVGRVKAIYNPVIGPDVLEKAQEDLGHPWLAPGQPGVVLGVGRLHPQKEFLVLMHAFASLRATRTLRLVLLGEGREREALASCAQELGIAADVDMPGWVPNPYAFMARAKLFVLSSAYEGLPGVLIQALACGCPVVSTDCPDGPKEILENGRFGPLVPVGDVDALSAAMANVLDNPMTAEVLSARGRSFSVDVAVDCYLDVIGLPASAR